MYKRFFLYISVFILYALVLSLTGCSNNGAGAPLAVESYYRALVAKDLNLMINSSCAEWEEQAKIEYNSFAAVDTTLEEMECQQSEQRADYTLVSCSGRIIANYGAEDLVIDLADFSFKTIEQNGEWLMCGY